MSMGTGVKVPWHFWLVALAAIAWNAFGAIDFSMTQLRGDSWLRQMQMTEPQIAYFHAMPAYMHLLWGVGTWGAVTGALLMLMRNRRAVAMFAMSLLAYVLSLVYTYLLSDGWSVMGGPKVLAMQAIILAGCLFFLWYAVGARRRQILR